MHPGAQSEVGDKADRSIELAWVCDAKRGAPKRENTGEYKGLVSVLKTNGNN